MKKQLTLAGNEFERFRKPTRRECFLAEMDTVVPRAAPIEPYYSLLLRRLLPSFLRSIRQASALARVSGRFDQS